ncbi:transcriptional repressor [Thioalkalicoccus limnaeus]|uniref:Ferric uptake regulation protein n=1 Tax=Thioalkalicoccus limnaeus TaxID=120681 RepID=A0ABV4BDM1_9GAMM
MTEPGLEQWLNQADALCRRRGARLTAQRRRVLAILGRTRRPLGAYAILDALRDQSARSTAPPTVYRALEFLLEHGLIHRIESLHAFIGCTHPEHPHAGQFLICRGCGLVEEKEDDRIQDSLGQTAQDSGFKSERPVVELIGLCADCRARPISASEPIGQPGVGSP